MLRFGSLNFFVPFVLPMVICNAEKYYVFAVLFFFETKIEVEIFESESIDEAREMPRSWKLMKPGKCREVGN